MITANFHDVTKLELKPVVMRTIEGGRPYYRRDICLVKDGVTIELTLFADLPDHLYLPGETYPEREIATPEATKEPDVCMECNGAGGHVHRFGPGEDDGEAEVCPNCEGSGKEPDPVGAVAELPF